MAGPRMTLHSYVFPQARPGRYRVDASETLSTGDDLPDRTHHLEVTSPRVTMPGNELFGVFPPPNAMGPFAGRLAQAVLRRRTLPWDRSTSPSSPWLALVVLAEGEANFLPDVPAAQAFTSGFLPPDVPATARCAALEVPRAVVNATFPAATELELLCHARQVDVADTEYADEDGWVAVVLSNRLPLPGRAYGAYLISLEGQTGVLPPPGGEQPDITIEWTFEQILVDPGGLPRLPVGPPRFAGGGLRPGGVGTEVFRQEDARPADAPTLVATRHGGSLLRHDIDFGRLKALEVMPERELDLFRFPVLAHWQFTCSEEAGDFAGYMIALDVGLLGSIPTADPRARQPETLPTGHVGLDHTDRRGDSGRAWYRGPFTPSKVTRDEAGRPYHVADQARRIGTDGREDLSYASAFEIGRLLAMSDLQFLRALRAWARTEYALRRQVDVLLPGYHELVPDLVFEAFELPRVLTRDVLVPGGIGGDPLAQLGPIRPVHEAELRFRADDTQVLARGLGMDETIIARTLGEELSVAPVGGAVLEPERRTFDDLVANPSLVGALRDQLAQAVAELQTEADRLDAAVREGTAGPIVDRLLRGGP
jgi:hypothetical protein